MVAANSDIPPSSKPDFGDFGGSRILSLDSNKSPSLDQWLKDELRFLHGRNHALLGAAGFFKQVGQVIRHSLLWQKMEGILSKWVGIRPARCRLKCLTSCFPLRFFNLTYVEIPKKFAGVQTFIIFTRYHRDRQRQSFLA